MLGIAVELNRLAEASRNNSLSPDDIQGGTFTISNFGTFRNITGTPIINQPQVAILATGGVEKQGVSSETPTGDVIAIRHKMILSLPDHRVVDGALGGMLLRRIADLLEEYCKLIIYNMTVLNITEPVVSVASASDKSVEMDIPPVLV